PAVVLQRDRTRPAGKGPAPLAESARDRVRILGEGREILRGDPGRRAEPIEDVETADLIQISAASPPGIEEADVRGRPQVAPKPSDRGPGFLLEGRPGGTLI